MNERVYAVLAKGESLFDPYRAAECIVETLRLPRYDAVRKMRDSGGIISERIPESSARRLAELLEARGIGAFMIPCDEMVEFPPGRPVVRGEQKGLSVSFFSHRRATGGTQEEMCEIKWTDLVLVTAARVAFEEEHSSLDIVQDVTPTRHGPMISYHTTRKPEMRRVTRDVVDLFAVEPPIHLRLDIETFDFRSLGIGPSGSRFGDLIALLEMLKGKAPEAYFDWGVRLFLDGKPETSLRLANEKAYDNYTRWMVQLVYFPEQGELPSE